MLPKFDINSLENYKIIDYLPVLEKDELNYVYRPNDDSFLFLDALRLDLPEIINFSDESKWILEIGYFFCF